MVGPLKTNKQKEGFKMAKQVRETTAGGAISAFVVLNKKGEHVATVNAHYSNGGRVSVDVWNHGDKAAARCLATAKKTGALTEAKFDATKAKAPDYYTTDDSRADWAAYDLFGLQQSSAGGYGYDKFAAALSRLIIDGHTMADHCGQVPECEKARAALMRQYCKFHDYSGERARAVEKGWDRKHWDKRAAAIGASFANYSGEKERFTSLHFVTGLDRLRGLGYRVIQAI
jgi:hypothetical protein